MMRITLTAATLALLLSACMTTPVPSSGGPAPPSGMTCNADPAAWAIGKVARPRSGDSMLPIVLTHVILDRLLGLPSIDWQKIMFDRASANWAREETDARSPVQRHEGTKPSHALADFAGDFENPAYGLVRIEASGGALRLAFHGAHGLEHVHYDVFAVPRDQRDDFDRMRLVFETDATGAIVSFTMPLEPETKPIVFVRRPKRPVVNEKAP